MKIEIGESLLYSWLRHVKECQIVQTNWKASSKWELLNTDKLQEMMVVSDEYYKTKYGYDIFKHNSLSQLIAQAEIDVLGISLNNEMRSLYAIDVAFHESGLVYGSKQETAARVIKKCVRSAMCLYGCFDSISGEVIFASPKVHNATLLELIPKLDDLNNLMTELGYEFRFRLIANDEFDSSILQPILLASGNVADTSELFMRSYQMYQLFSNEPRYSLLKKGVNKQDVSRKKELTIRDDALQELKIGKIAQTILRDVIASGDITEEEIRLMQTVDYSKRTFDLQYPLLVNSERSFDHVRYYSKPLILNGVKYYLCSQWFEVSTNNDRPYLIEWLKQKGKLN